MTTRTRKLTWLTPLPLPSDRTISIKQAWSIGVTGTRKGNKSRYTPERKEESIPLEQGVQASACTLGTKSMKEFSKDFFLFRFYSNLSSSHTLDIFFLPKKILQEPLKLNLHCRDGEGQLKVLEYRRVHDTKGTDSLRLVAKLDINGSRVTSEESRVCFPHLLVYVTISNEGFEVYSPSTSSIQ